MASCATRRSPHMPAGQHWSPNRNAQVTVDVCCEPGNHSQPTCPAGLLRAGYPGAGGRLGRQLAAVSRLAVLLHVHRYNLLLRVRACCCLPCIVTLWAVPPDLNTLAPRAADQLRHWRRLCWLHVQRPV